eukprot:1266990-Rhodomonas_salina.2
MNAFSGVLDKKRDVELGIEELVSPPLLRSHRGSDSVPECLRRVSDHAIEYACRVAADLGVFWLQSKEEGFSCTIIRVGKIAKKAGTRPNSTSRLRTSCHASNHAISPSSHHRHLHNSTTIPAPNTFALLQHPPTIKNKILF